MKKILALSLFVLILSGCGRSTMEIWHKNTYTIKIIKNAEDQVTKPVSINNPGEVATLDEVMGNKDIRFTTAMHGEQEVATELEGVITTASKHWQLYINGEKKNVKHFNQISIIPKDSIEWRYEETKQ